VGRIKKRRDETKRGGKFFLQGDEKRIVILELKKEEFAEKGRGVGMKNMIKKERTIRSGKKMGSLVLGMKKWEKLQGRGGKELDRRGGGMMKGYDFWRC